MPRINYKCTCDKCKVEITSQNYENDVSFNSLMKVYCDDCFKELMCWWECWDSGNYKVVEK
jgi:hypothetical protein